MSKINTGFIIVQVHKNRWLIISAFIVLGIIADRFFNYLLGIQYYNEQKFSMNLEVGAVRVNAIKLRLKVW